MGHGATRSYALKDSTKAGNASRGMYTDDQIEYIKRELKDMLYFFGYVNSSLDTSGEEGGNPTGFYQYDEQTDREEATNYKAYQALNKQVVEWTSTMSDEMLSEFQYQMSDKTKEVDLLNFQTAQQACKAIQDRSERKLYGKSYVNCK